jgi:hypothetical protein
LKTIFGSAYDHYDFVAIEGYEDVGKMLKTMEKNENKIDKGFIGEINLHL